MIIDVLYHQHFSNVEEWRKHYSPVVNPEAAANLNSRLNVFNNISILVKNNIVDLDFIWQSINPMIIISVWEKVKPLVVHWRKVYNDPEFFLMYEFIYDETKKKYPEVHHLVGKQEQEMRTRWYAEREKQ
jgi:hypothetical protein